MAGLGQMLMPNGPPQGLPQSTVDARQMASQPTDPSDWRARLQAIIAKARTMGPDSVTKDDIAFVRMILGEAPAEDSVGFFGEAMGQGAPSGVINTPDENYGGDTISTPVGRMPPPSRQPATGTNMMGGVPGSGMPLHKLLRR